MNMQLVQYWSSFASYVRSTCGYTSQFVSTFQLNNYWKLEIKSENKRRRERPTVITKTK
jgi:hypothetical protein